MSPKHWLYTMPLRLRSIFQRPRVEQELDDELLYHLDMKIEENVSKGMSDEEARRSALLALGGLDQRKEECRDARGLSWLADMQRNFRYSFRRLAKAPILSLAVILSLGLGIGANTAIFSVMYQILLRPLPVENPEELALGANVSEMGSSFDRFSYEGFRELERRQERDVAQLAGVESFRAEIDHGSGSRSGSVLGISGGYFSLVRIQPLMGRALIPADDRGAGSPVAMLGYSYWRNRLGGRTNILNQPIWAGALALHRSAVWIVPGAGSGAGSARPGA